MAYILSLLDGTGLNRLPEAGPRVMITVVRQKGGRFGCKAPWLGGLGEGSLV